MQPTSIKTGTIAIILFFALEIITDIVFSAQLPDYVWYRYSLSQLGHSASPLSFWVSLWGVLFFILLSCFAYGCYQAFYSHRGIRMACLLIGIYALGEGLGSGFFPLDDPTQAPTILTRLHNIFSGIGDVALVLFPFALMQIFPKPDYPAFRKYLWFVIILGLSTTTLFLLTKYTTPPVIIAGFKGLWQRSFLFNYHMLFFILGLKMWRSLSPPTDKPTTDHLPQQ